MGIHVFPILNPLPPPSASHPSGSSQCTSLEHPFSCIKPGLAIYFTYDIHVSMLFSQIIPTSPSPTESKSLFFTSVSHLFLISSASARSTPFLSFIEPIFSWNAPLGSLIFLKRSLDFPIVLFSCFFALIDEAFLSLLAMLWKSALKWVYLSFSPFLSHFFFTQLFVRVSQETIYLPFCISFSWGWSWSLPVVQCHEPPSIVL